MALLLFRNWSRDCSRRPLAGSQRSGAAKDLSFGSRHAGKEVFVLDYADRTFTSRTRILHSCLCFTPSENGPHTVYFSSPCLSKRRTSSGAATEVRATTGRSPSSRARFIAACAANPQHHSSISWVWRLQSLLRVGFVAFILRISRPSFERRDVKESYACMAFFGAWVDALTRVLSVTALSRYMQFSQSEFLDKY